MCHVYNVCEDIEPTGINVDIAFFHFDMTFIVDWKFSMENEWTVLRLIPLAVALRQRNEIELIANAQGMSLMEIESETKLQEMSDQVLEAVFDRKSLHIAPFTRLSYGFFSSCCCGCFRVF